ncbi:PREDICTED: SLAM family member 5-like [Elephantulus edwardii]|uniref:SLAM family member 5-like n=1 Tax=Elephantulus edwardii TaxID=28737 RepID=UPI0003F09737|nr:PREDICTED: SLAM family member 5-like [Elephantulus edwardii]
MAQHCLWILLLCLQNCRLEKPKITPNLMASINNTCNVTLTCSVEKEEKDVTYRWSPLGEEGNVLTISLTPDNQDLAYSCTAQNPVSNNTDSISTQHLCAGTVMGLRTHSAGLLGVLALLILLVIIISPLLLFRLYKRKQDMVSKKIMYENINGLRDSQPAESRIYDEISQPKVLPSNEESEKTIYSTVEYSKVGKTSTCDRKPPGTSSYEIVI